MLLPAAPLSLAWLTWGLRGYARGVCTIDWAALGQLRWLTLSALLGWATLVTVALRRIYHEYRRRRAIRGIVTMRSTAITSFRDLFAASSCPRTSVYALASHVVGNRIDRFVAYHYALDLPRWPAKPRGFRCVQLSDLHVSRSVPPAYYERVVSTVNALQPAFVFLTGDYGHTASGLARVATILGALQSSHGVFFSLGNHDIWHGADAVLNAFQAQGFTYVGDTVIRTDVHGAPLYIAGTNAPWSHRQVNAIAAAVPPTAACIVLRGTTPRLVLSGHTHGGQIALPWLGPLLVPSAYGSRHADGFLRYGATLLYVNRGLSLSLPFRIMCPPEIAVFDIV
jgi:hypothetical protein